MAATRRGGFAETATWGYHWKGSDRNDESQGMLAALWADLRGKQLPKAESSDVEDWYEEEQAARRAYSAGIGLAHNVDPERRENWRRRYWN